MKYGRVSLWLSEWCNPISNRYRFKESSSNGGDITGFFVRKERKPHGLQKIIEGNVLEPAVILDDVMTTGHSIRLAIDAVREENNEPEQTWKSTSLFRHSDFKQFITEQIKRKK